MHPSGNSIIQITFAVIVGVIMWQVQLNVLVDRWYELFLFSAFGGILYISLLAAVRVFTNKDYLFFKNLLNPKDMKDYIGEEMSR